MALKELSSRLWWANKQSKKQKLMERGCGEAVSSLRKQITSARTFKEFEVFEVAAEKDMVNRVAELGL